MKTILLILSFICIIITVIFYFVGYFDTLTQTNKNLIIFLLTVIFYFMLYLSTEQNNKK